MDKYYYPAVFEPEKSGFSIYVPDIDGCMTQAETMEEGIEMLQEVIGLSLENFDAKDYPVPSMPNKLKIHGKQFVVMVAYDHFAYQRKYGTNAVKKTLSIPEWMNTLAEKRHINFSGLLQDALRKELSLS